MPLAHEVGEVEAEPAIQIAKEAALIRDVMIHDVMAAARQRGWLETILGRIVTSESDRPLLGVEVITNRFHAVRSSRIHLASPVFGGSLDEDRPEGYQLLIQGLRAPNEGLVGRKGRGYTDFYNHEVYIHTTVPQKESPPLNPTLLYATNPTPRTELAMPEKDCYQGITDDTALAILLQAREEFGI